MLRVCLCDCRVLRDTSDMTLQGEAFLNGRELGEDRPWREGIRLNGHIKRTKYGWRRHCPIVTTDHGDGICIDSDPWCQMGLGDILQLARLQRSQSKKQE
jgi:hypothetical protein